MQTRKTFQKALTLDAVREMKSHPTADQIYAHVAEKYPEISRATIYRNLNQLSETGEIQRFKNPCGADHFEQMLTPHYHFMCKKCGRITDVELDVNLTELINACQQKTGGTVTDHLLVFEGICENCCE
ncbi:MAG: transcriptional repressor [Ruminococcaceae bacterium]|nr:transcriptional repressor [Oscillospiraceae bacterium]